MDRILKRLLEALDAVKLRYLIGGAIVVLILFAEVYLFGTSRGWGLKDSSGVTVDFWSCLYFSVVTFTSLGFGDLVPTGSGRFFAGVEVVLGLTIFGLAVAKLSSYKQSYLLNQIYARDVQGKLDLFAEELRSHRSTCKQLTLVLKTKGTQAQSLGKTIENIKTDLTRIRAFVSFESRNGYLLSSIPTGSITRLLKALSSLIPKIIEMTLVRRSQSSQKHRESAQELIKLSLKISKHFAETRNESVISEAILLRNRCESAASKLREVSAEVAIELKNAESRKRAEFEARNHLSTGGSTLHKLADPIATQGQASEVHATTDQNAEISASDDPR